MKNRIIYQLRIIYHIYSYNNFMLNNINYNYKTYKSRLYFLIIKF